MVGQTAEQAYSDGPRTALQGDSRNSAPSQPAPSSEAASRVLRNFDRRFHLIWLTLSIVVVAFSVLMEIRNSQQVNIPFTQYPMPELCSFRRLSGMDCAGCGLTRCFISLGHGDIAGAWSYNPAGILLFAMVLFQIPFRASQLWRIHRGQPQIHLGRLGYGAMVVFAVLMLVQWGVKQAAVLF